MKKKLALIISILLLNPACSIFHLNKLDEIHQNSCGPKAMRDALSHIHKDIKWIRDPFSKKEISQEIQKTGNLSRIFLGIFHREAFEITWPCEIERYFNNHNVKFKKINKIQDLKDLDDKRKDAIEDVEEKIEMFRNTSFTFNATKFTEIQDKVNRLQQQLSEQVPILPNGAPNPEFIRLTKDLLDVFRSFVTLDFINKDIVTIEQKK